MLLAMILGLSLAEAQENDNNDESENGNEEAEEDSDEMGEEKIEEMKKEFEDKPRAIIEKSLPKVIVNDEDSDETKDGPEGDLDTEEGEAENEEDGVIGEPEGTSAWTKIRQTEDDFGLIFRPQLGFTTLQLTDSSYSGFHAGLNLGYKKYHRLQLANVGVYTRSRALILPTRGELRGSDLRIGAVGGVKLSALELEAGADLLRHSMGVSGTQIDYGPSIGFATPVQALVNFEDLKLKVELEPRWYIDGSRDEIDWNEHEELTMLPIQAIGQEFAWTIGARLGWFGLSYEQLHMSGGIQRTISWGLQR